MLGGQDAADPFRHPRRFSQVVLPNPNDGPTLFAELVAYVAIPRQVTRKLSAPKAAIGRRLATVLGAAVPEAPINEKGHLAFRKDEVRVAIDGSVAPPTRDPVGTQDSHESEFGGGIASAFDIGHDFGAFLP